MKTIYAKKFTNQNKWYLIDAKGKTLGRLSTQIASILMGKQSPNYHPAQSCNNYIILINSKDIEVSGQKRYQKLYYRHSGRPGSLKNETFEKLQERLPNRIIEQAVRKMLPKSKLGHEIFKHLKIYKNDTHPHTAHNPIVLEI